MQEKNEKIEQIKALKEELASSEKRIKEIDAEIQRLKEEKVKQISEIEAKASKLLEGLKK